MTAILAIAVFLVEKAGAIALSQANRGFCLINQEDTDRTFKSQSDRGFSLINVPNKIAILKFNQ